MKTFTVILALVLSMVAMAGCTPRDPSVLSDGNNPYAPQAGDSSMLRGDIRIDSASIHLAESNPPHLILDFAYFQPTPCFQLRVVPAQPDAQNEIKISAYAVTEKDKACTLMALATPLHASLDLGRVSKGTYSVWLNGQKIGTFTS